MSVRSSFWSLYSEGLLLKALNAADRPVLAFADND